MLLGACEVFSSGFLGPADGEIRPLNSAAGTRLASLLFLADSATEVRDAFGGEALAAAIGLMSKYADVPMDFPDATLVWIAELVRDRSQS